MPEICRFYGIVITMYYNEHNPPHFHALYGDFRAEIDIRTLKILNGDLPNRAKSLIKEWAEVHNNELMEDWNLARQKEELKGIEPLK
jgi:hypothetical protein